MDKEAIIKILQVFAAVIAAFVAGMLGFYAQWKVKQLDNSITSKKEKENQKLKFYIPLLRCLYELDDRFIRIFKNLDKDWLSAEYLEAIKRKEGFAKNPKEKGYFIISSIYLIAYFFGVTEAIRKGVDTTKLSLEKKKKGWFFKLLRKVRKKNESNIFQFDPDITIIFRLLQNKELFIEYISTKDFNKEVKDAHEIHKQIQHSIGEMMLKDEGDEKFRVKSFREFYEQYINDEAFQFWFLLIEGYFTDLSNFDSSKTFEKRAEVKNDIRPLRLLAIQYWCRKLMSNISKELELDEFNFETRKPDDVLKNAVISEKLKAIIISYKLENPETYLGIIINNE